MATNTVVPVASDVEGNITSCGIEQAQTNYIRNSPFSLIATKEYTVYNKCTGATVNTVVYDVFTPFMWFLSIIAGLIVWFVFMLIATDY